MLPVRPKSTALALAACAAMATLAPQGASAHGTAAFTNADVQRAVLLGCKDELGYRGDARLVQRRTSSGAVLVRMAAYDRMDESDAAAVNACADRRAGTYVADGGRPLIRSHPACPAHDPILFLGSAYCFKGR